MARVPSEKSETYEAIPATMALQAAPMPAKGMLERARKQGGRIDRKNYQTEGAKTLPTSVDSASAHAKQLLKECRQCFRRASDPSAIRRLLNDHPWLIADPWVREKFYTFARSGRLYPPRGRPRGTFTEHPLLIHGFVRECIVAGVAKNPEQAFDWVAERLWLSSYDEAKRLYYQTQQDSRFRAILLELSDQARPATTDEIAHLETVEQLRTGVHITRMVEHPRLGKVGVVFEAVP